MYPGPCTSAFLITGRCVAGTDWIFWSCDRQCNPSWGWSARRMLLPFVSWQDWHGWLLAHYYLFLQGLSQYLGYFPSLASQPCPIWKITQGIFSDIEVPFIFWYLRCFRRGLRSGWIIFSIDSTQAVVSVPSNILGVLRSCRWVWYLPSHPLAVSSGSRSSQSPPWFSGFPKFLERLLRDCEQCPGKFGSCLIFFSSRDEGCFNGPPPFSPTGFRVNPPLLIFLSCSDFAKCRTRLVWLF